MSCISPYYVKNNRFGIDANSISKIPVPCGRCPNCIERRVNEWILRLKTEELQSSSSYFITLTYDTDHVPITKNGYMTLEKTDLQKFWKRLRKLQPDHKVKYYAVGEYGTIRKRPHYHAIVFNTTPENIAKAWTLGATHHGTLTNNSVAYTVKYMAKPYVHYKAHGRDDRAPEFANMSKGLGANYLTKAKIEWHRADLNRNFAQVVNGIKMPLPRYLRERLYTEEERKKQAALAQKLNEQAQKDKKLDYEIRTGDKTEEGFMQFQWTVAANKLETYRENSVKNRKKD